MITRPMLAVAIDDLSKIKYPVLCSPKLDGIRCLMIDGQAVSRNFKSIPNNFVREYLEKCCPSGVDGELMVKGNFNDVQSAIMREEGEPDFLYFVFDCIPIVVGEPYQNRLTALRKLRGYGVRVVILEQTLIENEKELLKFEELCLKQGFEGIMVRSLDGPYKEGRSTLKEGYLLKLKRFTDSEAVIVGYEEMQHNNNKKEVNEVGRSKRSSKKEGMVGAGMLGKFKVKDVLTQIEFEIGTGEGLTRGLRMYVWDHQAKYMGKIITYKYQACGTKDKPRFPIFKGFRDERDL